MQKERERERERGGEREREFTTLTFINKQESKRKLKSPNIAIGT
jgi:hypothetical protein